MGAWTRTIAGVVAGLGAGVGLGACWGSLDCEEADRRTEALLVEFGSCSDHEACQVVDMEPELRGASEVGVCIGALVCAVALRGDVDRAAFVNRARDIVERRSCNTCTMAKCRPPESLEAYCDPEARRCKLR